MDLRAYYTKMRETQAAMPSPQVVMVSLTTPDGGKPGIVTEVPTPIAARMVVEGSARRATESEATAFREQQAAARQAAEEAAIASRVQVVVLPAGASAARPPVTEGTER